MGRAGMSLQVRLGSSLAVIAGQPFLRVEGVEPGLTAVGLRALLARLVPPLAPHLPGTLVVADGRVLGPEEPIPSSGEIAVLQPMAGGC